MTSAPLKKRKSNNIPAGYQLHIASYEGDLDNQQTTIVSGLMSEDVAYLLTLLKNFGDVGQYGNDEVSDVVLVELFTKAMTKHPDTTDVVAKFRQQDTDSARDAIHELLGSSDIDWRYVRRFNGYKVFYVPHEIIDVSDQFK